VATHAVSSGIPSSAPSPSAPPELDYETWTAHLDQRLQEYLDRTDELPANGTAADVTRWFQETADLGSAEADWLMAIAPMECYRDQYEAWTAAVIDTRDTMTVAAEAMRQQDAALLEQLDLGEPGRALGAAYALSSECAQR
jgi:predicted trehalose synthase